MAQDINKISHGRNDKGKIAKFCRVCGAKAISFNYNGLTCESCKTFFRRNSFKLNNFQCAKKNQCEINCANRIKCKRCRLDRCYAIGMKKELIWKSRYEIQKWQEFQINENPMQNNNLNLNPFELEHLKEIELAFNNFPEEKSQEIVAILQLPRDFAPYPQLYIRKFIKYCKSLSSFNLLNGEDQLSLIKSSYVQTLNIRFAFNFNPDSGQFPAYANLDGNKVVLMNNALLYQRKNPKDPNQPVRFIKFQQSLNLLMENDVTIRNLVSIQLLFSNRNPTIHNCEFIRHQFFLYSTLLLRYFENKNHCKTVAREKYYTLMQALQEIDYQVEKIREMFVANPELGKRDPIHKEIFDL